jgi:hypothetical protein
MTDYTAGTVSTQTVWQQVESERCPCQGVHLQCQTSEQACCCHRVQHGLEVLAEITVSATAQEGSELRRTLRTHSQWCSTSAYLPAVPRSGVAILLSQLRRGTQACMGQEYSCPGGLTPVHREAGGELARQRAEGGGNNSCVSLQELQGLEAKGNGVPERVDMRRGPMHRP